jgi:hypothetical protein
MQPPMPQHQRLLRLGPTLVSLWANGSTTASTADGLLAPRLPAPSEVDAVRQRALAAMGKR